jgi:hypothetical protein
MSVHGKDGLGTHRSATYRWALRSILIPLLGGVAGAVLLWSGAGGGTILDWLAILVVVTTIFCLWRLYDAVQEGQGLSEDQRRRYLKAIPLVGPVAALEIVVLLRNKSSR